MDLRPPRDPFPILVSEVRSATPKACRIPCRHTNGAHRADALHPVVRRVWSRACAQDRHCISCSRPGWQPGCR